jgi:hypothetical protein
MAAALDAIAERRCTAVVAGGGKSDSPSARFYNRGCLSCYQRNAVPDHGNFDGVADVGTRQSSSMRSQAAILFVADGPSGFPPIPRPCGLDHTDRRMAAILKLTRFFVVLVRCER